MFCVGEEDQLVNALSLLKERAENDEASSLFSLCTDLSKVSTVFSLLSLPPSLPPSSPPSLPPSLPPSSTFLSFSPLGVMQEASDRVSMADYAGAIGGTR